MDSNNYGKTEEELKEVVIRACRQMMQSLEQEPSAILEGEDMGDIPERITGGG